MAIRALVPFMPMLVEALPDDPGTLKAMLLAERARAERLEQIIKELQRHRFGRRGWTSRRAFRLSVGGGLMQPDRREIAAALCAEITALFEDAIAITLIGQDRELSRARRRIVVHQLTRHSALISKHVAALEVLSGKDRLK